ncbi:rnase h domain-containing protein [Citrus sinensis]|uniref:Rnase h domain-containing protein n=1 Tax=Citrus sinensis TaxID=2711 RepID=A0ACB8IHW7_CITSI|nr:rnase h domain-containing protein [Citrus sinensis]
MWEDAFHALVGCRAARKVWKLIEFYKDIKLLAHQDMLSVLQELAGKRKKDDLGLIIPVCWAIWYARNKVVNEGKQEDPQITTARAAATVKSYLRIKCPNVQGVPSQHNNNQQVWNPPPTGWYKVNMDAAIQMENSKAGLGVVIRDTSGKILAAAIQITGFRGDVACMEAEAVLFGIQVACQAKCDPIIIESDSLEVVELSLQRKSSMAEICWAVKEIQAWPKNQSKASIQFVPRNYNVVAHSLAKVALDFESPVVWLEDFPIQIMMLLSQFV